MAGADQGPPAAAGQPGAAAPGDEERRDWAGLPEHLLVKVAEKVISQLLEDEGEADANDNFCHVCRGTGDVVCCDECPRVFHMHCIAPRMTEAEEAADHWACRVCPRCRVCTR